MNDSPALRSNPPLRRRAGLLLFASLLLTGVAALAQAPPPTPLPKGTELSEAQRKAIDSILADARAKAGPITQELDKEVRQVRETLLSRKPDEAGRQRLLDRLSGHAAQLVALRINTTARILGILNAEQKDLVDGEERKVDLKLDVYEVLVKLFGLPRMG